MKQIIFSKTGLYGIGEIPNWLNTVSTIWIVEVDSLFYGHLRRALFIGLGAPIALQLDSSLKT